MGDKLHRREGNSPDRTLRSLNDRSVIKEVGAQRQPGGLPRSLERVRNSSLIERSCAEDERG